MMVAKVHRVSGRTWTNMASFFKPTTTYVTRGFDRSRARHLVGPDSCWDLLNLRPVRGRLEQTPWIDTLVTMAHLTGESADTATHLIKQVRDNVQAMQYLIINETNARFVSVNNTATQVLLPCVVQTVKPANITLTGECLLWGHNTTDFNAANDTITVAIHTDGSHFRWNRNGGSWSSDLVIGPQVAVGANGLYVSFQGQGAITDYVNFTVGDTWTWKRLNTVPYNAAEPTTYDFAYTSDNYNSDTYIGGVDRNILRVRNNFITSVGYTRAYGMHVAVFYNHLFISQYAAGVVSGGAVVDTFASATTPNILAWSHLNNPDQLFATNINEADQYTCSQQGFVDLANVGITGLSKWRSLLYVFLSDAIYTCQYVGLPNVMQFDQLNSALGSIFKSGVVRTPMGIYFIGRNDVYVIRSFEPEPIGLKVRSKFFAEVVAGDDVTFQRTTGIYNSFNKEVVWTYFTIVDSYYQQRQMVYCELTDDWYFRNIPCADSAGSDCTVIGERYDSDGKLLYGYAGNIIATDLDPDVLPDGTHDVVGASPSYTEPYFETPFLREDTDAWHIKQASALGIDCNWGLIADTADTTEVKVGLNATPFVAYDGVAMTDLAQTWTFQSNDRLSLPRVAYRNIAYRFKWIDSAKPVTDAIFNFFTTFIRGSEEVEK